ncbi:urease accessory protein UreF, partial [Striga asiatica]
ILTGFGCLFVKKSIVQILKFVACGGIVSITLLRNTLPLLAGPKVKFNHGTALAFNNYDWKEEKVEPVLQNMEEANTKKAKPSPFPDSLRQWSQWQLLDSILPTGGFAHSYGLEAATQARLVNSPQDLKTFIIHVLENTGSLLLPFVHSASLSPDSQNWRKLDRLLEAMLTNEASRRASVSQGSALMRVASSVFSEIPNLKAMRDEALRGGSVFFHHAPVFGLVCGLLGFGPEIAQRAYVFVTMRDLVSAATRLNLVGPLGAAVLQHQVAGEAEEVCVRWMGRGVEEACQVSPLLDTVQGCHAYLFSRLFCS